MFSFQLNPTCLYISQNCYDYILDIFYNFIMSWFNDSSFIMLKRHVEEYS